MIAASHRLTTPKPRRSGCRCELDVPQQSRHAGQGLVAPCLEDPSGAKTFQIEKAETNSLSASLRERDFYGWIAEPCAALDDHNSGLLDWGGLKEELEALGRQEYRELVSRLEVLLGHLITWERQPDRRSRSWCCNIREQRRAIERLLHQHPSLSARSAAALSDGFETGVDLVLRETSPWTLEQATCDRW